jgi:hypothetical protein
MQEMKNYVARAFLNKLLNDAERKDLRNYERGRERYLVGFEICRRYSLKPEPLVESQMMAMDALYYKYTDMLEKAHNEQHANPEAKTAEEVPECPCPVGLDALYAWEDYAAEQVEQSYDWKMAITVVLLTLTCR